MIGIKDQYFGTEIEMTGITRQRAVEEPSSLTFVAKKLLLKCLEQKHIMTALLMESGQ